MVTLTYEFQVPHHILEVDGCRVDALDCFAQGFVIAYHKRSDGSTAWKVHEPQEWNRLMGSFGLKDTTIEKIQVQQEE